jgi:hypothetical protein
MFGVVKAGAVVVETAIEKRGVKIVIVKEMVKKLGADSR